MMKDASKVLGHASKSKLAVGAAAEWQTTWSGEWVPTKWREQNFRQEFSTLYRGVKEGGLKFSLTLLKT